ncbi:hypothetical protein MKEN_00805400 [Mycena kentingensis (nom. inval.)]|nr:hypothetical protein MKEN_00805400 [Mycena kentingensis (nom. inval.)]
MRPKNSPFVSHSLKVLGTFLQGENGDGQVTRSLVEDAAALLVFLKRARPTLGQHMNTVPLPHIVARQVNNCAYRCYFWCKLRSAVTLLGNKPDDMTVPDILAAGKLVDIIPEEYDLKHSSLTSWAQHLHDIWFKLFGGDMALMESYFTRGDAYERLRTALGPGVVADTHIRIVHYTISSAEALAHLNVQKRVRKYQLSQQKLAKKKSASQFTREDAVSLLDVAFQDLCTQMSSLPSVDPTYLEDINEAFRGIPGLLTSQ